MTTFLVIAVVVILAAAVLILPLWGGRRRRGLTSLLTRYQTIAEALLDGDLPRAREELKEIIRADTEDVAAYLRLARLLRREGDLERAVAVRRSLLARSLKDRKQQREILAGLITDLLLLRRYGEARAVGEQLRTIDRRHPQILRADFYHALHHGDWGAALRTLPALRRAESDASDPEPFQVRTYIAERRAAAGELREARELLGEALKANPRFVPALLLLGDLWSEAGEPDKAAEVWARLLRERPEAALQVIERLEKAYFESGRFGELTRLYGELVADVGSGVSVLRLALARMALRKGDAAEALRIVQELSEASQSEAAVICWRLYFLLEAGHEEEARALLKETIEAAVTAPTRLTCPHCSSAVTALATRCPECLSWLPDPVPRRSPATTRPK